MSRVPWFHMLLDCLCGHPAHPEKHCERCLCIKYIEDTEPYPIGEIICT